MTNEGRSLRPRKKQTHIEDFSASEAEEGECSTHGTSLEEPAAKGIWKRFVQSITPASEQHSAADVSPKKAQRGAKRAAGPARAKQPAKRSKAAAEHAENDEGASEQPSTPDIKGKGPAAKAAKREQEAQHAAPIQDKLPNSVEAEERKTVHINRAPVLTLWVRAEAAMQSTPACLA